MTSEFDGSVTHHLHRVLFQVEEMLKRSFAEFHAQKAIGGHLRKIERLDAALKALKAKDWPDCPGDCTKTSLRQYYELHRRLNEMNREWMPHILKNGKIQKVLQHGRVLLVFDKTSGLVELGVILPDSGSISRQRSKKPTLQMPSTFRVLSLHNPGPWDAVNVPPSLEPQHPSSSFPRVKSVTVDVSSCEVRKP